MAPTEAGARLLEAIVPAFGSVDAALGRLREARDVPAGRVRLTAVKHAARHVLGPVLPGFLDRYPDIAIEITTDDHLRDIVTDGFDAGVRLGERVDKDMIGVRISSEIPTALVATADYLDRHPLPESPQDLLAHECIGHRMGTGALHPWPFQEEGRPFSVKVKGRLTFNDSDLILDAALAGRGVAYLFADQVADAVRAGRLVTVLDRWTCAHSGYFLYYVSRRQQPPALAALVAWLREATADVRS